MKFKSFEIKNYRGIKQNLIIDVDKYSILPIIGVNESGKTSILQAIFSFDHINDQQNRGIHLADTENFYLPNDDSPAYVRANISITNKEMKIVLNPLQELHQSTLEHSHPLRKTHHEEIENLYNDFPSLNNFWIERNIPENFYRSNLNISHELDRFICEEVIKKLPYILYFDDFRDDISQFIAIPENENSESQSPWIPYFQELFKVVDYSDSIYSLREKSSNQREAIIRKAQKYLQETLAKHWTNFSVSDASPLEIELKYHPNHNIEIKIVEKIDINGHEEERFFNIKDRSKGFYWYFNFIMKLEFNPSKRFKEDTETIYLLDEPGSYLHASAQSKLCGRLKSIALKNIVIYSTHSPYLLDPSSIPINTIQIASKKNEGEIVIESIHESKLSRKNAAFQPILHALEIFPISLNYDSNNIILTEGIYDYYTLELFKTNKILNYFPCDSANSIKHHISYMIFLGKSYAVIWDLDDEGKEAYRSAQKAFGSIEEKKWGFYKKGRQKKVILQNLIEGVDLTYIKDQLGLASNSSFKRVISALYYSRKRRKIINGISSETKSNFVEIEKQLLKQLK